MIACPGGYALQVKGMLNDKRSSRYARRTASVTRQAKGMSCLASLCKMIGVVYTPNLLDMRECAGTLGQGRNQTAQLAAPRHMQVDVFAGRHSLSGQKLKVPEIGPRYPKPREA